MSDVTDAALANEKKLRKNKYLGWSGGAKVDERDRNKNYVKDEE